MQFSGLLLLYPSNQEVRRFDPSIWTLTGAFIFHPFDTTKSGFQSGLFLMRDMADSFFRFISSAVFGHIHAR